MKPGYGWVPVTPRGRAVWDCADDRKFEAENNACRYGINDRRFVYGIPSWHQLQELGWAVVKCYVGTDL